MGKGCFSETGISVEKNVFDRFVAGFGGVDEDGKIRLEFVLANKFIEPGWSQRGFELLLLRFRGFLNKARSVFFDGEFFVDHRYRYFTPSC